MLRLVVAWGALCLGGCGSCGGGDAPSPPLEADPAATAASAVPSFHKLPHAHRRVVVDGGVAPPLLVPPSASTR